MNSDYKAVFEKANELITMLSALEGKWTTGGKTADAATLATIREGVADLFDVQPPAPVEPDVARPGDEAIPGIMASNRIVSADEFENVSAEVNKRSFGRKRNVPPDDAAPEAVPAI
jgi:hypothetical protein